MNTLLFALDYYVFAHAVIRVVASQPCECLPDNICKHASHADHACWGDRAAGNMKDHTSCWTGLSEDTLSGPRIDPRMGSPYLSAFHVCARSRNFTYHISHCMSATMSLMSSARGRERRHSSNHADLTQLPALVLQTITNALENDPDAVAALLCTCTALRDAVAGSRSSLRLRQFGTGQQVAPLLQRFTGERHAGSGGDERPSHCSVVVCGLTGNVPPACRGSGTDTGGVQLACGPVAHCRRPGVPAHPCCAVSKFMIGSFRSMKTTGCADVTDASNPPARACRNFRPTHESRTCAES